MPDENEEALLQRMQAYGSGLSERAKFEVDRAKLDTILANKLSKQICQLSLDINHSKTILGKRIEELTGEMSQTRAEMGQASQVASQHAAALVKCTRWLVVVTFLYTLATAWLVVERWLQHGKVSP